MSAPEPTGNPDPEAVLAAVRPGEPEMFATLQGEGASTGRPAFFVRFARCNLHCYWCDTPYTWNWDGGDKSHRETDAGGTRYTPAEETVRVPVSTVADTIAAAGPERCVFTGGEPLLQQGLIVRVLADARRALPALMAEVETNGTILPTPDTLDAIDQFNVSPKLPSSRNPSPLRHRPEVIDTFARHKASFFKFVIAGEEDLREADRLIEAHTLPRDRVLLMPEGIDSQTLDARLPRLAQEALARGVGISDRLHLRLYGNTRGT